MVIIVSAVIGNTRLLDIFMVVIIANYYYHHEKLANNS